MKLRLSILLLAAALAASPAAGQTIKSLGYNTTNGQVVAATNVTFTNSVNFSTNARAATRTNLGLGATNDVQFAGVSVVDGNIRVLDGTNEAVVLSLDEASYFAYPINFLNINALSETRDHLGLKRIVTTDQGVSGWITEIYDDTNATNPIISVGGQAGVTLYGPIGFSGANTVTNRTLSRNALGLGATNNVTFSNITATGTLGVSNTATFATNVTVNGNATLNGVGNTAPSQTADSGASLMTRELSDDRYFNQPNLQRINVNNFTGAVVGGYSAGQLTGLLNAQGQTLANAATNSFAKMGQFPGVIGARGSFNFSSKMRVKVDFMVVATAGSFSNSSVHYIVPTVSAYNAGFPAHRSFGFAVSGDTIKGFTHNGTNYVTTTNSVTWTNQHRYLGVVENDGAGNYSFGVNSGGTFNSLGTIAGPTGAHTADYLFGANVASTNTNDVNGYYIVRSVDLALTP